MDRHTELGLTHCATVTALTGSPQRMPAWKRIGIAIAVLTGGLAVSIIAGYYVDSRFRHHDMGLLSGLLVAGAGARIAFHFAAWLYTLLIPNYWGARRERPR